MAPRTTIKAHDPSDVLELEPVTQAEEIEESLLTEFSSAGNDASFSIRVCSVSKEAPHGMPEEYLFTIDSSLLPSLWDTLRDKYGSGLYRAHVFKTEGGRKTKFRQFDLPIRAPERQTEVTRETDMAGILRTVSQQNEAMMARFERLLSEKPVATTDPMAMFERALTTVTALLKVQQVQAPAPPAGPSMESMLNLVTQGIELGKASGGESESIFGILKEIARQPAVGDAIVSFATSRMNPAPAPHTIQDATGTPPPAVSGPHLTPQQVQLTNHLNYLAGRAAAKKNIQQYVDWFIDNTDASVITQLLARDNLLNDLCAIHKGVADNKEWFAAFIDDLRGAVQAPAEAETPQDDAETNTPPEHDANADPANGTP